MFLTALEGFDYKPYVREGELSRGEVVTEGTLLWRVPGEEPITVPAGFVTDLASLPWFTNGLFKKLGRHQRAAVLHDWLYREKSGGKVWSDKQFNLAMKHDGVSRWRRVVFMAGLTAFGWTAWYNAKPVVIV